MADRRPLFLPGLPEDAFLGSVAVHPLNDRDENVLVSATVLGVPIAYTATWIVNINGGASFVGRDDPLGKGTDVCSIRYRNNNVRQFTVEAANAPGSSGSTSGISIYDFGAVPTPVQPTMLQKMAQALIAALEPFA